MTFTIKNEYLPLIGMLIATILALIVWALVIVIQDHYENRYQENNEGLNCEYCMVQYETRSRV